MSRIIGAACTTRRHGWLAGSLVATGWGQLDTASLSIDHCISALNTVSSSRHASLPLPSPHPRSTHAIIEIYLPADNTGRLQVSNCLCAARRRLQGSLPRATFDRAAADTCCRRHQSDVIDKSLTVHHIGSYFVRRCGWLGAMMARQWHLSQTSPTLVMTAEPSCVARR